MAAAADVALPSLDLYAAVPGQERAVDQLRRSALHPVHAYLLAGPPGTGKKEAAIAFAASLLCPNGGDGTCRVCRQVQAGTFIDLNVFERTGASISVPDARWIIEVAARTPSEGRRKVIVLDEFHLVEKAAPALLKTIEEPPASAVFVILADSIPPELVTIASRCVRIDFAPLTVETIRAALEAEGVEPAAAAEAAAAAAARLDRARLLAQDPDVAARRVAWQQVPSRLDGTGATVAIVTAEVLELIQGAPVMEALTVTQRAELAALDERAKLTGERITGRKDIDARHKREARRLRTDELRWGLSILAAAYRDRAAAAPSPRAARSALAAVDAVQGAAEALIRNPNEVLLLQALLLKAQPPG
jgi:DNA polymerase III subunit delta'